MKLIVLTLMTIQSLTQSFNPTIGTAQNQHYIQFNNNTGYYIENDLDIKQGDKVVIINDNVYVIDSINR